MRRPREGDITLKQKAPRPTSKASKRGSAASIDQDSTQTEKQLAMELEVTQQTISVALHKPVKMLCKKQETNLYT